VVEARTSFTVGHYATLISNCKVYVTVLAASLRVYLLTGGGMFGSGQACNAT